MDAAPVPKRCPPREVASGSEEGKPCPCTATCHGYLFMTMTFHPIDSRFTSVREVRMKEISVRFQKSRPLTLLLTCLDTTWIPCLPASTASQVALWIGKRVGLGILQPMEVWPSPWGLTKSYDSQDKNKLHCKKVQVNSEMYFWTQTDDNTMILVCGLGW